MLNKSIFLGRLTADPELKTINGANGAIQVVNFSVAVARAVKKPDGTRDADFIECTAWGKTAEFIAKYFAKAQPAVVVGRLTSQSWQTNTGEKRYKTFVTVDEIHFAGSKPDAQPQAQAPGTPQSTQPDAPYIPPQYETLGDNDELPF